MIMLDKKDEKITENNYYLGFEEIGVQKRLKYLDSDGKQKYAEGLRYVTVISDKLMADIADISTSELSYGYVVAPQDTFDAATKDSKAEIKLDMSVKTKDYPCTADGVNKKDHRTFDKYRMFTFVITYDDADEAMKNRKVIARPYIKYTDANGLECVHYFNYGSNGGTSVHKGLSASFNSVNYKYDPIQY